MAEELAHEPNAARTRRAWWVFAGFLILAGLILAQAWRLQVRDADEVLSRRNWRLQTNEQIVAPRGQIRDRNGVLLAESVQSHDVYLDVRGLYAQFRDEVSAVRAMLSTVDGFDASAFDAWNVAPLAELTRHERVQRQMSPAMWEWLSAAESELGINVFYEEPSFRRFYPEQELAGNIIGFVASDGFTGRAGIEAGMDERLRGNSIEYSVERDMSRRAYLFGDIPDLASASGDAITLTIDSNLQSFVEQRLRKVTEDFEAKEAMAIVSDVDTGELLAVGSWPPFNPNHPFDHSEDQIWVSHPLSRAYEPGSTAKIVTFAAALNEGLVTYSEPIDCEGGYIIIDNERVRDTHPEEIIPAWKVLQVSSNIGALKIGMRMSDELHFEYLHSFGLGEAPDIGVQGVGRGILQAPPWIDIKQANMAFGHGFASTALQTHMATTVIAAGGELMAAHLIRSIRHPDGTEEQQLPVVQHRAVSRSVADQVTRALEQVVQHEDGTGKAAAIDGVRVAGKTGTANLVNPNGGGYMNEYLASFSGFLPADNPRFAITVWVLHPNTEIDYYGGKVAAPVFRDIGEECLRLYDAEDGAGAPASIADAVARYDVAVRDRQRAVDIENGVEPDERGDDERLVAQAAFEELAADEASNVVPDFRGMWVRPALSLAERYGLATTIRGTGTVVAQSIEPGEPLDGGFDHILLQLGSQEGAHEAR